MITTMSMSFSTSALRARRTGLARALLVAIGLGSLVSLAIALIAQHAFGIEPCAWCVIQRVVVILVALACGLGVLLARVAPQGGPILGALAAGALSVGGAVAAWHQHTVAAKQLSCAFTWADRTLMALPLDDWLPSVFHVGATCADAAGHSLLGQPFEVWSGVWFVLCTLAALGALTLLLRPNR